VDRLRPILERPGQSLAQGALRFCLSHPVVSTVIVGSTNPAHVRQNAEASEPGPLPAETVEALRAHRWERNFYRCVAPTGIPLRITEPAAAAPVANLVARVRGR